MKKICLLCFLFLISFLFLPLYSQNRNKEFNKIRLHFALFLEDRTFVEYTSLDDFSKLEIDNTGFASRKLLLDLGKAGRWVYDHKEHNSYSDIPDMEEESFACLESGETVKISYTFAPKKGKIEKYTVTALPSGKTLVLPFDNAQKKPKDFIPFVKDNFSETFILGLDKIRKIVFFTVKNDYYFELGPNAFRVLWGVTEETMFFKPWPQPVSEKEGKWPQLLYCNCDFDAKFGYPCSKDEIPAKNPKVLVVPQK